MVMQIAIVVAAGHIAMYMGQHVRHTRAAFALIGGDAVFFFVCPSEGVQGKLDIFSDGAEAESDGTACVCICQPHSIEVGQCKMVNIVDFFIIDVRR